ncbi:MAG: hypothetical protein J6S78_03200 [Lachnospiraceae bacterium]|nr:hypothetical protein [Lachnospiraceae bacterium]
MDRYNNHFSIAKGVSLVAFGFLFLFLDFNLIFSESFSIDILPDAVGWLLFLLSVRYLEDYIKNPTGMRVFAFFLFLEEILQWSFSLSGEDASAFELKADDLRFLFFLMSLCTLIFFYQIHGIMIRVAEDFRAPQGNTIRILRPFMLFIQLAVCILFLFPEAGKELFLCVVIPGVTAAIVNLFALFGLREEVINADQNDVVLSSEDSY